MTINRKVCLSLLAIVSSLLTFVVATDTSATSLTLIVSDTVSLNIIGGTSVNGTFAHSSISDTTISVKTDNYTGYTLGIAASNTNITALTNTNDNTITIPSITSAIDESTFSTSTNYNNKWGYRPSKFNSSSNTNYLPAPSASTNNPDTLDQTNSANPTTANTYNIAIGARINNDAPPGKYTNSYIITAVANGTPYTLTYNANAGSDTVSNMPANVNNGVSYADTIILNNTTPTRTGYTFAGWCDTATGTTQTSCGGTMYTTAAELASFPIDRTASSNDVNVYAIWTPSNYTISYNANSGSGSIASQTITGGSSVTLADNAFTRTNYYFKGWATSSGGAVAYRPSQSITPTGSMTLYAVWGSSANANLYDAVASLTRGNQTNNNNATTGIKTNPTKATSGVYTYNASVFGTSSDSTNTSAIYYYRGILDTDLDGTSSTYGSNGNSMNYPNYVKLGDMCWRIVRTTGSGGVKMIYNGSYSGGTTANSCANATTNAQLTTQAFGLKGNSAQSTWYYNINRVGYTFNNTQSLQDSTTSTSVDTVFGSDSNPSTNNERSNIKKYIEDTWYASNMTSWTSKLEASAGYCNDRSAYSNTSGTTTLTTIPPYGTSSATMYFGAYTRNSAFAKAPSLTCPRSTVDLYRYVSGSTGVSNQLKYPVALLTADEASFAGSGTSSAAVGSGYHYNSYLRSGSNFWLLSPSHRSSGYAYGYDLYPNGCLGNNDASYARGVRPVISLKSGTTIESGSGTATSPWVIAEPKAIQDLTLSQCSVNVGTNGNPSGVGDETTVVDKRDNKEYTVRYINGECWMTQNLRYLGDTGSASKTMTIGNSNSNVTNKSITLYSLNSSDAGNFNAYSSSRCDSTNGYNYACVYDSGDTSTGVWYNYYAASGGTISGNSNSTATTSDICPKNWHLPTGPSTTSNTDFNKLVGNTTSGYQAATTGLTAFGAVAGGCYFNGSLDVAGYGHWWSATAGSTPNRYFLEYNSSNGQFRGNNGYVRYGGYLVRCVRSS